jgi:hypothetical protein
MRQPLFKRLEKLEEASAYAREQREENDAEGNVQKAVEKIMLFLNFRGIERKPQESLEEAFARALEIGCDELRELMAARICPIGNYFATKYADVDAATALRAIAEFGGISALANNVNGMPRNPKEQGPREAI